MQEALQSELEGKAALAEDLQTKLAGLHTDHDNLKVKSIFNPFFSSIYLSQVVN
jgi:hypothetical protein